MKRLLTFVFLAALFTGCQKNISSSNSSQPLSSGTRLTSVRGYTGGVLSRVDTFFYSSGGNLLTQNEVAIGTGGSDTLVVSFIYGGSNSEPTSYTIKDGFGLISYALTYDNQDRVLQDAAAGDPAGRSSSFSYPDNNIAYTSVGNESADTFYLSNNNIVKTAQADIPFDPSDEILIAYSYSPIYPNPLYYTGQTENVKILLTKIDGWEAFYNDCISPNAFTAVNENDNGFAETLHYTTDASGRVISLSASGQTLNYTYSD